MSTDTSPALADIPDHPIELLRTRSLMSVLQDEIERMILAGTLAPGERINEIALATRFGTSRGPIREACRSLAHSGLVELVPNRGVYVRKLDVAEASHVYDVRTTLFGLAGRLFAARITAADVARLRDCLADMEAATEARDIERYYPLNLDFHRLIMAGAGNPVLERQYHALVKELHLYRRRGLVQGGGLAVSNREHRVMVEALAARDADAAEAAHRLHVARAKDRMLAAARRERAAEDAEGARDGR